MFITNKKNILLTSNMKLNQIYDETSLISIIFLLNKLH